MTNILRNFKSYKKKFKSNYKRERKKPMEGETKL